MARDPRWNMAESPKLPKIDRNLLNGLGSTLQIWHMASDPLREHGVLTKIEKNQNPTWPQTAMLTIVLEPTTFECLELDTSNLAQG